MCVIIVCPRGVDIPSKKILQQAKSINRHGFGFVSESKYFRSMDFEEFYRELKSVSKSENIIIHMRYATHGSVKLSNCHPFFYKDFYFAHNGILDVRPINDTTDSETAFKTKIFASIIHDGYDSEEFDCKCRALAGSSRFAFMRNGDIKLMGTYYEVGGIYYSNIRFLSHDINAIVVNM